MQTGRMQEHARTHELAARMPERPDHSLLVRHGAAPRPWSHRSIEEAPVLGVSHRRARSGRTTRRTPIHPSRVPRGARRRKGLDFATAGWRTQNVALTEVPTGEGLAKLIAFSTSKMTRFSPVGARLIGPPASVPLVYVLAVNEP